VVTNAHVVAGEADTTVQVDGAQPGLAARTIDFDPHDDVAVLRVHGLSVRPLPLATGGRPGASAAILGYPLDGPFSAQPGRLGHTQVVNTEDAYGNGPVQRSITSLRGLVRPGNSGGPMVDAAGHVVATVFAAITGQGRSAGGFAVPNALVAAQLKKALAGRGRQGTGSCGG
jgi:S1-C subfamily serine protease